MGDKEEQHLKVIPQDGAGFMEFVNTYENTYEGIKQENEALPEHMAVSSPTRHTESESDEITSNEEPDEITSNEEPDASVSNEEPDASVAAAGASESESEPEQCTSGKGSETSEVTEDITPSVPSTSKALPDRSQSTSSATPSASSTPTKAVQHRKVWRGQVYDARSTTMFPPEGNGEEGAETVSKKLRFDGADLERVTELRLRIKQEFSKRSLSPTPASHEGNVSGEDRHLDREYNSSVKTLAEIQSEGHYILYCKVVESHQQERNTVLYVTDGTIPSDLIKREKACSMDNGDRNAEVSRTVKVILKLQAGMKFQNEFVEMIGVQAETIVDAYSGKTCLAFVLWNQNINIIPATHTQAELIKRRLQQINEDANRSPSAQITDIVKREPIDQEIENENISSGHDVSGMEGLPENRIESERQECENQELEGNMKKKRRIAENTEVQDSPDENAMLVSIRCIKSRGLEESVYLVEGAIIQIEPPINADNLRKDIVSGYCSTCNTFSRYSSLIFNLNTQKHTCPQCPVDRRKTVSLVFSLSFHVVDKTNEELVVRLCGESAMEFFGVTVNRYLRDPQICKRVNDTLLNLLPGNEGQRPPRKVKLCIQSSVDVSGMRYMIKKTYLSYNARE